MKRIFFKTRKLTALLTILLSLAALCVSCSDVYDNIKDFSMKERIYPAHFDTIVAYPGYERVEILLSKQGRIPPYLMSLGKAEKTIVEYDAESIVFDSICSWVNIDSLTLPKLYRFRVYTVDGTENQNRSIPMEIALTPYTSVDREALGVPNPDILSFASFVMVNWPGGLSSDIMDYLHMEYSYQDQDGVVRTGSTRNTQFFVQNTAPDVEVPVSLTCWVYPKINSERILDSVSFTNIVPIRKSIDVTPIDFTVSPSRVAMLPGKMKVLTPSLQYGLKWTSSDTRVATVNANGVVLARNPGTATISVTTDAIDDVVATATIIVPDVSAYPRSSSLAGIWTFEDGDDLVKPSLGLDLIPLPLDDNRTSFVSIEGPNGSKGVRIGNGGFYGVKHEMLSNGMKSINAEGGTEPAANVNEYTMMMDIRIPASDYTGWKSLFNTHAENTLEGIMWSNNGDVGRAEFECKSEYNLLKSDSWHRVVFAVQLSDSKRNDVFRVYVDGERVAEAIRGIEVDGRLSINANTDTSTDLDFLYIGADEMGKGKTAPDIAELRLWSVRLSDAEIRTLGGVNN
jgi:hypothetical protein